MKRETYEKALEMYKEELARQDAKNSTGSKGKLAEVLLRNYILKKGTGFVIEAGFVLNTGVCVGPGMVIVHVVMGFTAIYPGAGADVTGRLIHSAAINRSNDVSAPARS